MFNKLTQWIINKIDEKFHIWGGAGISLYNITCEVCNKTSVEEWDDPICLDCCLNKQK